MGKVFSAIDLSIIIVNYNSSGLLEGCLDSIFNYTKDINFEVILIDNGSTEEDVESICNKFSHVILVKNIYNKGFAAANNQGLEIAKGKYILFLNNDTLLFDNICKKVYDWIENVSSNCFCGVQLLNADKSKQESIVKFPSLWNTFTENFFLYKLFPRSSFFNKYYQNYSNYSTAVEVDVIKGAFMFCPYDSLKQLNGFDERFFFYSEETDLCKRFKEIGGKIFFLPHISLIHYSGSATDKDFWFKYKNQVTGKIQYYQKHFTSLEFILAIFFHWCGLFLRGILFSFIGILTFRKEQLLKGYYFFKQIFVYPKNQFDR